MSHTFDTRKLARAFFSDRFELKVDGIRYGKAVQCITTDLNDSNLKDYL